MICEYHKYLLVVAFLLMTPICIISDLHDNLLLSSAHFLTLFSLFVGKRSCFLCLKILENFPQFSGPFSFLAARSVRDCLVFMFLYFLSLFVSFPLSFFFHCFFQCTCVYPHKQLNIGFRFTFIFIFFSFCVDIFSKRYCSRKQRRFSRCSLGKDLQR